MTIKRRNNVMRIKVSKLKPNPYRNLVKYKLDEEKVKTLMASINETTFWDNLLVREVEKFYEIAYGHHRLEALNRLGIKEVDLPVRKLDDAMMVKIMANENLETYDPTPKIINETVSVVKKFLDDELQKYDWERARIFTRSLFPGNTKTAKGNYEQSRNKGVGERVIFKFLGKAWKRHRIKEALLELRLEGEDAEIREACEEEFDSQKDAKKFRSVATQKEFKNKIKGKDKKEIARRFKENLKNSDTKDNVAVKKSMRKAIDENIDDFEVDMKSIEDELELFKSKVSSLNRKCNDLCALLDKANINEIQGVHQLFVQSEVADLLLSLKNVMKYFGFTPQNLNKSDNVIDINSKKVVGQ